MLVVVGSTPQLSDALKHRLKRIIVHFSSNVLYKGALLVHYAYYKKDRSRNTHRDSRNRYLGKVLSKTTEDA